MQWLALRHRRCTRNLEQGKDSKVKHKFYPRQQNMPELTIEQEHAISDLRDVFATAAERVLDWTPKGRYQAIVLTHLEEAAAMATKSITHHDI